MGFNETVDFLNKLSRDQVYDTRVLEKRQGDNEAAQDDYAARRVPGSWRWSAWRSLWAFSAISTAMVFPLTGALLSVTFGARATIIAMALSTVYGMLGVFYMTKKSAEEGALSELISRQTFGYKGSAYQILLYGLLGTVYFSLEGHVMSAALSEAIPVIPYEVSAAIVCIVFIPLTFYGMIFLEKFQSFTVWVYILGIILAFAGLFGGWSDKINSSLAGIRWWNINPNNVPLDWISVLGAFGSYVGLLGGSNLILNSTDTSRFIKQNEKNKGAVLYALLGVSIPAFFTPLFGVYLLAATGGKNPDPGVTLVWLLGPLGLLLIYITQIRINLFNVYFGTNAMENFSTQILKLNWKRSKYVFPFMIISYLLIVSPLLEYYSTVTTVLSVFLFNWANTLLGDLLLVRKKYGIPQWSEFRRGYAASYNKIGIYSMWFPTIIGILMGTGIFGVKIQVLAVPLTGILSFFLPIIISNLMSRERLLKQYFGRIPEPMPVTADMAEAEYTCRICSRFYHKSDFVYCPFHGGAYICSTCCASEKNCKLMCQKQSCENRV